MYESFGLIGIQLPEKYKENFDVSSEGTSTCTVLNSLYTILVFELFTLSYLTLRIALILTGELNLNFKAHI